jgi:hypothetical protein
MTHSTNVWFVPQRMCALVLGTELSLASQGDLWP